jgi:hypothetical protein
VNVYTFSESLVQVPSYKGLALGAAIVNSQAHGGTYLGGAVTKLNALAKADRLVVMTDEQSHDTVPASTAAHAYMVNVAAHQHGVGFGDWVRVSGFSERIVDFIAANEHGDNQRQ